MLMLKNYIIGLFEYPQYIINLDHTNYISKHQLLRKQGLFLELDNKVKFVLKKIVSVVPHAFLDFSHVQLLSKSLCFFYY